MKSNSIVISSVSFLARVTREKKYKKQLARRANQNQFNSFDDHPPRIYIYSRMKNSALYRDRWRDRFPLHWFIGNFSPEIEEQSFSSARITRPPLTRSTTRCDERAGPLNERSGTNEHIFLKARARKQSQWRGLLSFRDDWLVCKYVFLLFSLGPSSNFLSQKSTGCLTGERSIYVQARVS